MIISPRGYIAIEPPVLHKVETVQTAGGIAMNKTRTALLKIKLVFAYVHSTPNQDRILTPELTHVLVRGDSGAKPWAKDILEHDGQRFVLCPENDVIGFVAE